MKMKFKELCDFTTIDKKIIGYDKANSQYIVNIGNDANLKEGLTDLLNTIASAIRNRSKWAKFKRVNSMILGFIFGNDKSKIGSYNRGLKKALTDIREIIKDVISASKHFQLVDSLYEKEGEMGYIKNYEFPCKIQKGEGGVCTYFIDENGIKNFFKKYRAYRKVVKNKIKQFNKDLEKRSIEDIKLAEVKRAIAILENCLEIRLDPNISDSSTAEEIIKADLPRSRAYRLSDKLNLKNEKEETIIKEHIPFYIEEIEALEKGYEVGIEYDAFLHLPEQNISDKEVIKLQKKLKAFEAANCICSGNITDDNIKEIKAFEDSEEEPKASNSIVNMANEAISKKTRKIYGVWFCCAVVCILICAIISFHAPLIRYVNGKEVTTIVDGCEYTYRKFDDAGVEIIAAKMPEGISEYAVIPEIDGHKVVAISEGAFADYTDFESVYIGKDISQIGSNAFARKDNARITIYCEAQAKPDAWAKDWANDNVVVWGWTDSQQNIEITWGNLRFAIDKGKKQAAILGLSSEDKGDEVDEIEIPSNVTYEGEEYAVIRVADEAFKDAIYISKITLPASVTNIGFGAFKGCSSLTDIAIPFVGATVSGEKVSEEINTVNFGYIFGADGTAKNAEYVPATLESVTIYGGIIAANAFGGCSNLQNIILGNSVKSIAHGAFNGEMSIKSLTLPFVGESYDKTAFIGYIFGATEFKDNNKVLPRSLQTVAVTDNCNIIDYAFYGCENIVTVNIASSGETNGGIGKSAFAECVGLKTVTIKNGKFIDDSAFTNCTSLTKVTVPDEIESFGNDVLQGCTNIEYNNSIGIKYLDGDKEPYRVLIDGANIKSSSVVTNVNTRIIAKNAFNGCSIEKITISENVVMIGDSAFANCAKLSAVDFATGSTLKTIGQYAFANCTSITNIAIPDSVITISDNAFKGCSLLDKVNFGATSCLTGLGVGVFADCQALQNIVIPNTVTSIKKDLFINCSNLTSIVIPNAVIEIGDNAFKNCTNLSSVTFSEGSSLEIIGQSAFEGCGVLSVIALPDKIRSIGTRAFANCSMVTDLIIPANVTFVGDAAFEGCNAITNITMPTIAIEYISKDNLQEVIINGGESIEEAAFSSCTSLTSIVIPDSVTSIEEAAFYKCTSLTSIVIPDSVTSMGSSAFDGCANLINVVIGDSVTSIGDSAFFGCTGLTSIVIPDSVTSIGYWAFYNCTNLTSMTIPDSVTSIGNYAFVRCIGLTSIVISDGVTSIGSYAFYNCTSLTSMTIPDSVTSIGYNAFEYCTSLTSIVIPDSVTSIGEDAFSGCSNITKATTPTIAIGLILKDNLQEVIINGGGNIESYIFKDCTSLTNVTIGESVTSIGDFAFQNCANLRSIVIPDSVTSIEEDAFSGCSNITKATIPTIAIGLISKDNLQEVIINGGESIGRSAFYNCTNLKSMTMPDSVASIGSYAFYNCTNLTSISIPNSVASIGSYAFYNCTGLTNVVIGDGVTSIGEAAFYKCASLTSITIPDSATSIGRYAFSDCTSLTSIVIPDSVISIGDSAFWGCTGLTSIVIPSSVTIIGDNTFRNCTGLTSIVIPDSVTSIGDWVFSGSTSLTSIIIPDSVTSIGTNAFYGCSNITKATIPTIAIDYILKDNLQEVIINGGESIGRSAFYNCTSLTSIVIPDSVTSIEDSAFSGCTSLTSIVIPDSVTSIEDSAFSGCTGLISVTIGDSVTSIGVDAFIGCIGLTSIVIPDSVTSIGSYAFYNCTNLTSIVIPDRVTSIGRFAFYACTSMAEVIFKNTQDWQASTVISFSSYTELSNSDLADATIAATYLKDTYYNYYWRRLSEI